MIELINGEWKIDVDGAFLSIDDIERNINVLEEAWQELKGAEEEAEND